MQGRSGNGYYEIPIKGINPYSEKRLLHTTYLLGSPGSGKTRLLNRLKAVTGGHLAIESGVYDLFERCIEEFIRRKKVAGYDSEITSIERKRYSQAREPDSECMMDLDPDFQMPQIDGLDFVYCACMNCPLEKSLGEVIEELRREAELTTFEERSDSFKRQIRSLDVLPYRGKGVQLYREALGPQIISGGKSGFPDWLFVQNGSDGYIQMISFPGHHPVSYFSGNQSIPKIPAPDSVLFLVDPKIGEFTRSPDRGNDRWFSAECSSENNVPLERLPLHLADVLEFERTEIPVVWMLSKTDPTTIEESKRNAEKFYSPRNALANGIANSGEIFAEITKRIPAMMCFDSFQSSDDAAREVLKILSGIV